jgi:SAM-dependent methyltransferase
MDTPLPFHGLAKSYDKGRYDYPSEVIKEIVAALGDGTKLVLDLGCGTGLATRQLGATGVLTIGRDPDPTMIQQAIEVGGRNVSYCIGTGEKIDFASQTFNGITAFGCFHWFNNDASINEMRRVLKPSGVVAIVNKDDINEGPFAEARKILRTHLVNPRKSPKENYDPASQLKSFGFDVTESHFTIHESYPLRRYVQAIESISFWRLVPDEDKAKTETEIIDVFHALKTGDVVDREVNVRLVIARMR